MANNNDLVTLREHLMAVMDEREKQFNILFDERERQLQTTKDELERRLLTFNNVKEQIHQGNFVTQPQHELLTNGLKELQIWRGNIEGRMVMIGFGIVLLNLLVNALAVYFLHRS